MKRASSALAATPSHTTGEPFAGVCVYGLVESIMSRVYMPVQLIIMTDVSGHSCPSRPSAILHGWAGNGSS